MRLLPGVLLAASMLAMPNLPASVKCGDTWPAQTPESSTQLLPTHSLTGTYREKGDLDAALVKKVMTATARLERPDREGQARALIRILRATRLFAIEQYGTTITINYPEGTRVPYEADGKARIFRATGNETVIVQAELSGDRLTIDHTWTGGERLRLIYERVSEDGLTFTRVASNSAVPVPVSIVSEYERVSRKGLRKFASLSR